MVVRISMLLGVGHKDPCHCKSLANGLAFNSVCMEMRVSESGEDHRPVGSQPPLLKLLPIVEVFVECGYLVASPCRGVTASVPARSTRFPIRRAEMEM